jgi:predicted Zn-dependent protease
MERVLGHLQEALSSARRALSEEPNTVRGWLMMSRLELEGGKVGAARDALHEAVTRAGLIDRAGLTDYERELLLAPTDQLAELERILGQSGDRSASP